MSSGQMEIVIGWLYPTLMSTYGDRGNVITIERRAQWRGYDVKVVPLDQNATAEDIKAVDVIVGGGAQDRQQEIVMRDLQGAKADAMREKIENGTPGVFTCGSPQLLGHYYEPGFGQRIEGLGILDLVSIHPGENTKRCIGNLVIEVTASRLAQELEAMIGTKPYLVGFENHGGRTKLGKVEALGRVVYGLGNNGEDGTEGAFYQNAIATYSHGPLLPKNPFVADWLIQTALRLKYEQEIKLTPLNDQLAMEGREAMFKRLKVNVPTMAVTPV
ncbi:CobB/CobQ domain protein glutamine amidotransferase [Richelia sinica FACHB-800]|uniref:Lipid II isoglutaminyl synthase (glutamine-hydrolyzing) subunit GatD n=1 Tax=Richelia sinica FACHB-800 TaxID=1357546 RepID=A0A975T9W4_9NOST|nr:type 1 glutamine amidotransferase [Richelia sinica]MBD2667201.1 type 1 glutamine amidotransferase [Richelia sinica FACHB-800]QXE24041.1 CobB/CobQ domain protein glutamine amidotransferase [Richelia sinica FACHB-800]